MISPIEHHRGLMLDYDKQTREYMQEYGNDNCEYLLHRRIMYNYHRAAVNALVELEKSL